jgi:hypothetical protein
VCVMDYSRRYIKRIQSTWPVVLISARQETLYQGEKFIWRLQRKKTSNFYFLTSYQNRSETTICASLYSVFVHYSQRHLTVF